MNGPHLFLEAVKAAFGRAAAKGYLDRYYRIGGFSVRMRFAAPVLIPVLTRPFAHLAIDGVAFPDLTVCLGEGTTTGIALPPVPWAKIDRDGPGNLWSFRVGPAEFVAQLTGDAYHILEKGRGEAYYWFHRIADFSKIEGCSPLLPILHWWMGDHERQLVHAAAVGTSAGGVLLAGRGGTGKSTCALACLAAGLDYVGDDYCLLEKGSGSFVHSLYCSGKLNAGDIGRFPELQSCLEDSASALPGRAHYFFHPRLAEKMSPGFLVKAILIPQLNGSPKTSARKASTREAFLAIAPSTVYQLPGASAVNIKILAEWVRRLPCYILDLGPRPAEIPAAVRGAISMAAA